MRGAALALLVLLCGAALVVGYGNKERCTGPRFDAQGRSEPNYEVRRYRDVCYSDIQQLWLGREIDKHVFPYVSGSLDAEGHLLGGSVEYPVLTGMLIWAGAYFASTDGQFLFWSALLLAPFGLAVGWLLGRMARWRALMWALSPPLVLYAFHNWDLPAVACTVAALYFALWRGRPLVAAALLGFGFAFKIYPIIFVAPLALYVLAASPSRRDLLGAVRVVLTAGLTAVLVNLPFVLAGPEGWAASFQFQQQRPVDITANSLWFWGFRPYSDPSSHGFQAAVNAWSPLLVVLSFAVALAVGWWRYRREGVYPLLPVCASMLCGFLLLYRVFSPQYTLWLLPFFALVPVRWGWFVGFLVTDLAMGIGIFRWYYSIQVGLPNDAYTNLAEQAVVAGVWGRVALLTALFGVFLKAKGKTPVEKPEPVLREPELEPVGVA
ncbi:glycosyltransferase family 87 protein [Kutzneria albida]|uniref:Integral membrane protein n=1 Tax=Kutzneria albida DSM 43870 TaxID=1449976 RepID=W5WMM8_9PSEU|nr:glycosyltransferase 87 family protein [Kutzneria albida]AHI02113.1 hypothetical protein KALB_8756 [Kutzneria albida DSM 43870]